MNTLSFGIWRSAAFLATLWMLNLVIATTVQAEFVFAPPEAETILNGNSRFTPFDFSSARFQQVYDATIFSALGASGGGWIRNMSFRVEPASHVVTTSVQNMQVNMSTTLRGADELSAVFDQNYGVDDMVVVGPRRVVLLGAGGFDLIITLTRPFFYDPAKGNLLLDFRVYQGVDVITPGQEIVLDAFNSGADSVSSVYAIGETNLPTSGQVSTLGLAIAFVVTPVPKLAVSLQSNNLVVTWPLVPFQFRLEQSPVLGAGAVWQPAGGAITTNRPANSSSDMVVVTLPRNRNVTGRYFRLNWQTSASAAAAAEPTSGSSDVPK